MMLRRRNGNSMIEYTILMAAAAACFFAIYGLARSTFMGSYKNGADGVGHGMRYRGWCGRPGSGC